MSRSAPAPIASSAARAHTPLNPSSPAVATEFSWDDPAQRNPAILLIVLTLALIVAYWNMFVVTSAAWWNPLYSFGFLIPLFALGLLWVRRQPFQWVSPTERWIGLAILAVAMGARLFASRIDMAPVDRLSFIVALAGVFTMVGGWHLLRWAGPAIGYLVLMFPLPSMAEHTLLWNLQRLASYCSTVTLQTLGIAAYRTGNVIHMQDGDIPLNVAEACSGLRMLTVFCAMCVALVFLIERPWWDKFIILLSAVPIALMSNVIRIVLTALLYLIVGADNHDVHKIVHDGAGLFMMVIGMGLLWIEWQIISRLTVPEEMGQVHPVGASARGAVPVR